MPTAGPFRLEHRLSTCTVGDVWSGVDAQGRPVTVARLNELASADDRWREAFEAAAGTLRDADVDHLPVTDSDHEGERPWVACAEADAGAVFAVLGQELTPAGAAQGPPSAAGDASHQKSDVVRTEHAPSVANDPPTLPLQPVLTDPARPVSAIPVSGHPMSGLPAFDQPISAVPASGAPTPYARIGLRQPRPGTLLLLIVGLVSLLVGAAGGAAVVAAASGGDDEPAPVVSAAPVTYTDAQLLLPSAPPTAPGQKPDPDDWPDNTWPSFDEQASGVTEITGLDGLGFGFRAPEGWKCTLAEQADNAVHYRCGVFDGATVTVGGDIFVRACAAVCDNTARETLRGREEAWGLRWTGGTTLQSWVENPKVDGKAEYGLVYVGFWRTAAEEVLNREVVLRMTAPSASADDVKKVAYSVRDRTYTQ